MKTQRTADIAVGWILTLLGIFVLFASTTIRVGVKGNLSPRTLPYIVGFLYFFAVSDLPLSPGVSGGRTSNSSGRTAEG